MLAVFGVGEDGEGNGGGLSGGLLGGLLLTEEEREAMARDPQTALAAAMEGLLARPSTAAKGKKARGAADGGSSVSFAADGDASSNVFAVGSHRPPRPLPCLVRALAALVLLVEGDQRRQDAEVATLGAWVRAIDEEIRRVQKFLRPPFK